MAIPASPAFAEQQYTDQPREPEGVTGKRVSRIVGAPEPERGYPSAAPAALGRRTALGWAETGRAGLRLPVGCRAGFAGAHPRVGQGASQRRVCLGSAPERQPLRHDRPCPPLGQRDLSGVTAGERVGAFARRVRSAGQRRLESALSTRTCTVAYATYTGGQGFEPRSPEPESGELPDYSIPQGVGPEEHNFRLAHQAMPFVRMGTYVLWSPRTHAW